jgi:hypothetical protein
MIDLGDRRAGSTVHFPFLTQIGGVPTAATSLAIGVHKNMSGTPTTSGVSLVTAFGSNTGLYLVKIDLSQSFYATQNDFSVVITAGNVSGNTLVGYPLATFSVENRAALTTVTLVDGIELQDLLTAVLATLQGKAVPSGGIVDYLKLDGLTTSNRVTVGSTPGQRTASILFT